MDFVILGASSGMPSQDKHLSSILVRTDEHIFLLDCGEGVSRHLLQQGIGHDDLDAVFITHLHPDHFSGIYMLLQMLYLGGRSKPLYVYMPERLASFIESLQMLYTFPQKFGFPLKVCEMKEAELQFPEVSCVVNDHLLGYAAIIKEHNLPNLLMAYSLRIADPAGDFVYTSDLETVDSILPFAKGAHTIVVDAGHTRPEQVLKLQYQDITRVILTHDPRPELLQIVVDQKLGNFEEAREGLPYHI